jgi:hypothetical protein
VIASVPFSLGLLLSLLSPSPAQMARSFLKSIAQPTDFNSERGSSLLSEADIAARESSARAAFDEFTVGGGGGSVATGSGAPSDAVARYTASLSGNGGVGCVSASGFEVAEQPQSPQPPSSGVPGSVPGGAGVEMDYS